MNEYFQGIADKYVFADALPFEGRFINIVGGVGVIALTVSLIGGIIAQSNFPTLLVKFLMIASACGAVYFGNKTGKFVLLGHLTIIGFSVLAFPMLFFTNGGVVGGMAAYFVLSIILIVTLSKGIYFRLFLTLFIIILVGCYLVDYFVPGFPPDEWSMTREQAYIDTVVSVLIAGVFTVILIQGICVLYIRERVRAEEAGNAKGAFLANMSHEMRTPMNAIIGMTTIGLAATDLERKDRALREIEGASAHLLGVINDILDMSKIEANKLELSSEDFDFKKMVDDVVSVISIAVEKNSQSFVINIDPKIPDWVNGDRQRLAQVVTNLLSNATKFTPEGGRITFSVQLCEQGSEKCRVRFVISDTGIGITAEQMKRLFISFEQADNSTSSRYGGTGLGLAISKNIVELMEGSIWGESQPGEGSVFTFEVMLCPASPQREEVGEGESGAIDFTGRRILLVEDVAVNCEIACALLEPTNLQIECAENGREAIEMYKAEQGRYDLILMDIRMPEMGGYEATRLIRASEVEGATDIPIIAMTANVFKEDIEEALAAGMNDHLGKPVVPTELYAKLEKYL